MAAIPAAVAPAQLKLENSNSTHSLFHNVDYHLRFASSGKGCRGVVAMAGSGKFFVVGNWKCNGTKESISKLVSDLNGASLEPDVDVVVSPPFVYLDQVKNSLTGRIEVTAQNCWTGKGLPLLGRSVLDWKRVVYLPDVVVSPPFVYLERRSWSYSLHWGVIGRKRSWKDF